MNFTTEEGSAILQGSALFGLRLFLVLLSLAAANHASSLFLQRHGWSHRLAGGVHLLWIVSGAFFFVANDKKSFALWYDVVLGCSGVTATLTAARDFPHQRIQNKRGQSGTLEKRAIVTQSEMIEHSFYQTLNLVQALYLHFMAQWNTSATSIVRLVPLFVVTMPWWFRKYFPINSFSGNWTQKGNGDNWTEEVLLYQIKKAQYLFYKHAILHGINISVALSSKTTLPYSKAWRIFWLALNLSYVMEFFLQTMVKRKVLRQQDMLLLQRLLMLSSSLAALVAVFGTLRLEVFLLSLILNFAHRGHDVLNTVGVGAIFMAIH